MFNYINWRSHPIESILNRLTVPGFYLAPSENTSEAFEIVDGQQRLTTMWDFYIGKFRLGKNDECPYFGSSVHYAGLKYEDLDDAWKTAFRRYNLTMVALPYEMPLDLRLEIFRRINDGGTPLSPQDIRLSYYSTSPAVRLIQLIGIYDPQRAGASPMINNSTSEFGIDWPWRTSQQAAARWKDWWENTKTVTGQTPSEMFLWFVLTKRIEELDRVLSNKAHLTQDLRRTFRNRSDQVLDIVCAELSYEDSKGGEPRLFPSSNEIHEKYFPEFRDWWHAMRLQLTGQMAVNKFRTIAALIPALSKYFGEPAEVTDTQWGTIGNSYPALGRLQRI